MVPSTDDHDRGFHCLDLKRQVACRRRSTFQLLSAVLGDLKLMILDISFR